MKEIYLFKTMDPKQLEKLGKGAASKSYGPGEDIFTQGDPATALYIVKFGSVRIHQKSSKGDRIEISTLGTGSHFGEMAFLDSEKRSASVTAIESTEIITLPFEWLRKQLDEDKEISLRFYQSLAHFLCGRLRVTTNDLSFVREKNLRFQ